MMEYVNENSDATVCMETEYPNRPDGLVLLEKRNRASRSPKVRTRSWTPV